LNRREHIKGSFGIPGLSLLWITMCLSVVVRGFAQEVLDPTISVNIRKLHEKTEPLEVREQAARTLGHCLPSPTVFGALAVALQDQNEAVRVRRAVVGALTDIGRDSKGAEQAIPVLLKALSYRHPTLDPVRAASARAIGKILQSTDEEDIAASAVSGLVDALTKPDPDPLVRANAAWALGRIGAEETESVVNAQSIEALINAIRVTQMNVGQTAAQSLIKMHRFAVPKLTLRLSDNEDANFRWNIAWILGEIGGDAKDAVPSLTALLTNADEDPNARGAAAWAIGKIGPDAKAGTSDFRGTVAALTNVLRKTDDDSNIRSNAAWALGRLGPLLVPDKARFPDVVAAALIEALDDTDADIRRNAAWALGQIRPNPTTCEPPLANLLTSGESDPRVRTEIAVALGRIGPFAGDEKTTIKSLAGALEDKDSTVRKVAATSLGQLGVDAQAEIPRLVALSHKPKGQRETEGERNARWAGAEAVASVADALRTIGSVTAIDQLQEAATVLRKDDYRDYSDRIQDDVTDLRSLRLFNQIKGLLEWLQRYRTLVLGVCGYVVGWLLLYWKSPFLVFRLNEALIPYAGLKFPKLLGGIPLSYLMLGGILHYRPRVLDAWVASHIGTARNKFEKKLTVDQRRIHIDLPVLLDGKALPALRPSDLRNCFGSERTYLLVPGEGGIGKTSLACQICKWAMSADATSRLCNHTMVPIWLEQQNFEIQNEKDSLIDNIRRELWYLTDTPDAPSAELVERLLKNRRILLVVDGLSEMSEAKRSAIQPGKPQFAGRALLLTSRLDEGLAGVDLTTVKPMRVHGEHLSTFMDAYLVQQGKKELFSDPEYFDYLGRLSRLVQERDITVLLAKLYADQMIALKEGVSSGKLPENVPDLMLEYLNELNGKVVKVKMDDRIVHQAAKAIAWQCMKETFRSMPARVNRVTQELRVISDDVGEILRSFENELHIVQTIGAGRDSIRFTLDPLAEYLAALWLIEAFGHDERDWQILLGSVDTKPGAPNAISGFLSALRDCCVIKGKDFGIPAFVSSELGRRTHAA
jgi:HEAT repeat protein